MHEVVLAPLDWDDVPEGRAMELFGVMTRAMTFVAQHRGDYVLRRSKFQQAACGVPWWRELWALAVRAGWGTLAELEDGAQAILLIQDKKLFHMRSAEEIAADNQHRNDTREPQITMAVRRRDGDQCRWCNRIVYWSDRRSDRGGTYDHLDGRQDGPATVDGLVVCCKKCNEERGDARDSWKRHLLAPPVEPFYSKGTSALIEKHLDVHVEPSTRAHKIKIMDDAQQRAYGTEVSVPDPAAPVASGQAYGTTPDAVTDSAPATAVEHTVAHQDVVPDPDPSKAMSQIDKPNPDLDRIQIGSRSKRVTELDMPGRVWSGRAGQGLEGPERAGRRAPSGAEPSDQSSPHENHVPTSVHGQGSKKRRRRRRKR
ncbi:HNH endonuclease [Kocuria sp.]|uniref:HNH endonuclease n=1 Tax=Kocuria sp. TaxID=1871328 RepID=UPI0026DEF254|nr:hypothetical protein [Kocuria sp.]MDO5619288.1 hypothetical protein [Kocuria sp.]